MILASVYALLALQAPVASAATFKRLPVQMIQSNALKSLQAQTKYTHTAIQQDQGFYVEVFHAAVFKVNFTKGQPYANVLRQFTRYLSYWTLREYHVGLKREVRYNSFIDGLFPVFGDEDASPQVYALVDKLHQNVGRVASHARYDYAEFYFIRRPTAKNLVRSAEGWMLIDKVTGEILVALVGEQKI